MEPPLDETQALRGLNRTLTRMNKPRVGWLEVVIIAALITLLIAGFLSIAYVIQQGVTASRRDMRAREDSARIIALLNEFRASVARGPAATEAAVQRILAEIRKIQEQQTRVIVREQQKPVIVVVTASPQPQPTKTVYRPCQVNPVNGKCLGGKPN